MMDEPKSFAHSSDRHPLNYQDTYICPVCRHGHISAIALMDAFACDFCRHIFTANLPEQLIRVEDSSQPMTWRWNGQTWKVANRLDQDLTFMVWLVGAALVVLPPSLIWLSSHTFPPMRGSIWYWFPTFWVGLAFITHFLFVAWLLVEHYQWPIYVAGKVRLQMRLGRRV
jgi:rubredoxin